MQNYRTHYIPHSQTMLVIMIYRVETTLVLYFLENKLMRLYSLFQKKCTFNSDFFCDPPGGGRPKIYRVDYVLPRFRFSFILLLIESRRWAAACVMSNACVSIICLSHCTQGEWYERISKTGQYSQYPAGSLCQGVWG